MYAAAIALSILIVSRQKSEGPKIAQAGTEHNVFGYAWSENFGWVSFNCTNDGSCATVNYGVNIDLGTGNFSGYAWSSNLGWISFNRSDTGDPPDQPHKTGAILADYNSGSGEVNGWAKILSLGDDGWIKLRKFSADIGANYGVSIDQATGDFSGWAWNATSTAGIGLGWLSFNCLNDSSCASSNYKVNAVLEQAPEARNLTAFHWSYAQASQLGALKANLRWQFYDVNAGDTESAYQIIVDDDPNPNSNTLIDTGKCLGYQNPVASCLIDIGVDSYPVHNQISLGYNQKYYWWVKVWDSYSSYYLPSDRTQYDSPSDTDNDDGDPLTFTTYKHEFPDVDFTWFPVEPSRGEKVQFTDASKYYTSAAPATPANCISSDCFYLWTVPGDATIDDATSANPIIIFGSSGQMSVTLKVTDNDGYYTSLTKTLNLKQKLPSWTEVKPE